MRIDFRSNDGCRINVSQGNSNKDNYAVVAVVVKEAYGKWITLYGTRLRDFSLIFIFKKSHKIVYRTGKDFPFKHL